MALAVGDCDEHEAASFLERGRASGVPVNVIDKPAFCQFQFGSIVNRSPLVIGISTDGAAPILGQAVRRRIEAILPGVSRPGRTSPGRSAPASPKHSSRAPNAAPCGNASLKRPSVAIRRIARLRV
jgi:hypothetical protein